MNDPEPDDACPDRKNFEDATPSRVEITFADDEPASGVPFAVFAIVTVALCALFAIGGWAIRASRDHLSLEQESKARQEAADSVRTWYTGQLTDMKNRAARAGLGRWVTKTNWHGEPRVVFEWGACDPTMPTEPYVKDCLIDGEGPPSVTIRRGGTMQGCEIRGVPVLIDGDTAHFGGTTTLGSGPSLIIGEKE